MANYNLPSWFLCYLQFNPKPTLLVIHDSLSPLHSDSCHPPTHPRKRRKPHSSSHLVSCSKLLYKRTANYLHCLQLAATCPPLSIFTTQNNSLNFTRTNIFFSHSVDLYLVFIVSRVLLPQLELLWSKNEDIETQFKIEEISSLSEI